MDSINLRDILDGKLIKLPCELDIDERYEFVHALADALATRQKDFPTVGEMVTPETVDEFKRWSAITDTFVLFMMNEDNEFSTELVIAAFLRAIRINQVQFNSETEAFYEFYNKYQKWIVGSYENKGVYVGNGKWDKNWKPKSPSKAKVDGIGGHFTLRDHHKNQ